MNETFEAFAKSYLEENQEKIKARVFEYMDEHKDAFKDEILLAHKDEILLLGKIETATNLMKNTNLSLNEIALNVGLPVEEVESLKRKILDS